MELASALSSQPWYLYERAEDRRGSGALIRDGGRDGASERAGGGETIDNSNPFLWAGMGMVLQSAEVR